MSTQTAETAQSRPMPKAPSTLQRWFPIAVWLPKYEWAKYLTPDLIAAVSVAALLIPESMGYATVAGIPVQYGLYAAPLAEKPDYFRAGLRIVSRSSVQAQPLNDVWFSQNLLYDGLVTKPPEEVASEVRGYF